MDVRRPFWRGARPTRWAAAGFALIAVVTVTLPVGVLLPTLAAAAVAGCVVVDVVVATRARPAGRRSTVPTLAQRVPVPMSLSVELLATSSVRLRQPVPPEIAVQPDEQAGRALSGTIAGRHRGVHVLPPWAARATGPLGLGSADHVLGAPEEVTVLPDLPKARRLAAARRRGRSVEEGRIRSRAGIGTEFETIRDYAPDDDVRRINWAATARIGRPMANQFRVEENRDLVCVVDTGRLMASPVGPVTRLDVALDALATLVVAAEDAGDRVGAMAFAGSVFRQLAPRRQAAEPVVRALFDLEPTEVESDYERAFLAVGRHRRAVVALFTDLVDEAASRSLLAAAGMLARRHAVLVVTCRDPDLAAAVAAEPSDARGVLRAAVALDLLRSRDRTVALLRSMGIAVVEDRADRLGPAAVRAYLALTQRYGV